MGKKKSKSQKKKFFAHPKNKNKVFKKKERPEPKEADVTLRQRGRYTVLPSADFESIPQCSHGPCLLFGEKSDGQVTKRFFACAVYRSNDELCPFKTEINEAGEIVKPEEPALVLKGKKSKKVAKPFVPFVKPEEPLQYGCIPKKLKTIPKQSTLVFCRECNDVFETKHKCPSEVVERSSLRAPTRFLEALSRQSGEAQYHFSEESLAVVMEAIVQSKVDGVLCIGAPRVFEALRAKKDVEIHHFLLDYDKRYVNFFPSSQFAQYSMLVDHFYDEKAEGRLAKFFAKCPSVLLVCDPPFGVFIEPLMETIQKMRVRHQGLHDGAAVFYTMLIVSMFVGKHALKMNENMRMSDYRVTYDNHKDFAKPNKTTVRIFCDLKPGLFDLTMVPSYRYCEVCERHVSDSNKHCFMCGDCTSKDGSAYHHCNLCMRCVKASYRHCRDCSRCHLVGRCPPKNLKRELEQQHQEDEYE